METRHVDPNSSVETRFERDRATTTGFGSRTMVLLLVCFTGGGLGACSPPAIVDFEETPSPAGIGSAEPHLARGPAGVIVLSWLERRDRTVSLRFSTLAGKQWTDARTVADGTSWFVNWADFPSVVPIDDTRWSAHWLVKKPGGPYAYDIAVSMSQDSGTTWSRPMTPHTDGTLTEHGFVSLFPAGNRVGAIWLDGRQTSENNHESHAGTGAMTLRSALITADGAIVDSQLVDDRVCDCCQTDVALTANGPVAVYRNRTSDEIRDIYVARNIDGRWLSGAPVAADGWRIDGCPVNGPAIAAGGNDVVVAWFSAPDNKGQVRIARSTDGGATFSEAVDVDTQRPLGRVDVELLDDGEAIVSWLARSDEGGASLAARRFGRDGSLGVTRHLVPTTPARSSGFPQMVRDGDDLVFAWTDASAERPAVRTGTLPVAAFR